MKRVYERKFDWDDARRLHADGVSYAELGRRFGVTARAVRRVCDEEFRARDAARSAEWMRGGTCPDCGVQTSRTSRADSHRCQACAAMALATSVRETTLRCQTCREWKPDDSFPRHKGKIARRGRHKQCTACVTVARRIYRHSHPEQRIRENARRMEKYYAKKAAA